MRRFAFYLALTTAMMAAKTVFADAEVYLAARTDGKDGAGTATDPFNASTQAEFDALFAHFGPNTTIHLGPGTYHTKGMASFSVKPYWKIHGAGYEVTKIIQDRTGKIGCTVFAGAADGVEIEDLSIDCGFENQQVVKGKIKANASAIGLGGSHIAVRRCLFKNYGSPYDAETGENFAVAIGSPDPANGENLVVEDCIFAGMSPLLISGQSVLTIAGGPPKNDLTAGNWARGVDRAAEPLYRLPLRLPRHHHVRLAGRHDRGQRLRAFHGGLRLPGHLVHAGHCHSEQHHVGHQPGHTPGRRQPGHEQFSDQEQHHPLERRLRSEGRG